MGRSFDVSAALGAWRRLTGERLGEADLEPLAGLRDTNVWRLETARGAVIAKRCPARIAVLERTVYERMLTQLPTQTLRFDGAIEDSDSAFSWIFVEDAGGNGYDPREPAHRRAAARWLAALHGALRGLPRHEGLPPKQPAQYRELLAVVSDMLARTRTVPQHESDDLRDCLDSLGVHCRSLASSWEAVELACAGYPDCLVHGDIVTHNARIRATGTGIDFVPFDWEKSGWGTPAEDLSDVDLDAYLEAAGGAGISVHRAALARMAGAGKAFRCLVFLNWLGPLLADDAVSAHEQLRLCKTWLDQIVEERPWAT